jgi:5-methylcytosine-specific restriction endonuclease McrA
VSWLKLGDELPNRPEWNRVQEEAFRAHPDDVVAAMRLARDAKVLHFAASQWGARVNCDGYVPAGVLLTIAAIASFEGIETLQRSAEVLIAAGMWRRPKKSEPVAYVMVVSWEPGDQPTRRDKALETWRRARGKALSEGFKPLALAARSRAEGECEYCGKPTSSLELDHVDSLQGNFLENLAATCRSCNRTKGTLGLDAVGFSFTPAALARRVSFGVPAHLVELDTRGKARGSFREPSPVWGGRSPGEAGSGSGSPGTGPGTGPGSSRPQTKRSRSKASA